MCQSYSKPKVGRFLRHRVVLYTYTYMYLNTCAILQQLAELFLLLHILLSNSMILFGCKRYSNKHALHIICTAMFSCTLLHVEIHLQVISLVAKDRYALRKRQSKQRRNFLKLRRYCIPNCTAQYR